MIYLGNGYAHIFSNSKNKGNRNSNNLGPKSLACVDKRFYTEPFFKLNCQNSVIFVYFNFS